jgi:hypothetical protein
MKTFIFAILVSAYLLPTSAFAADKAVCIPKDGGMFEKGLVCITRGGLRTTYWSYQRDACNDCANIDNALASSTAIKKATGCTRVEHSKLYAIVWDDSYKFVCHLPNGTLSEEYESSVACKAACDVKTAGNGGGNHGITNSRPIVHKKSVCKQNPVKPAETICTDEDEVKPGTVVATTQADCSTFITGTTCEVNHSPQCYWHTNVCSSSATVTTTNTLPTGTYNSLAEAEAACKAATPPIVSVTYKVLTSGGTQNGDQWAYVAYPCPKAETVKAGIYSIEELQTECAKPGHETDPTCTKLRANSTIGGSGATSAGITEDAQTKDLQAAAKTAGGVNGDGKVGVAYTVDNKGQITNKELISENKNMADGITQNKLIKDDVAISDANKHLNEVQTGAYKTDHYTDSKDGTTTLAQANDQLSYTQDAYSKKLSRSDYNATMIKDADGKVSIGGKSYSSYGEYKKDLKADIKDAKATVAEGQSKVDAAQSEVDKANNQRAADASKNSMQNAGDAKNKGCTAYGGADCDKTKMMNGLANMADTAANIGGSMAVNNAGTKATNAVVSKGAGATQADISKATVDTAKASYNAELRATVVDAAGALMQGMRLQAHSSSAKKLNTDRGSESYLTQKGYASQLSAAAYNNVAITANTTRAEIEKKAGQYQNISDAAGITGKTTSIISEDNRQKYNDYVAKYREKLNYNGASAGAKLQIDQQADASARMAVTQDMTKNIEDNHKAAVDMQREAVAGQITALAGTLTKIQQHVAGMANAKAAQTIANANTGVGGGFSFNPGGGNSYGNEGTATAPIPEAGAIVDGTAADNSLKDTNQLNPGADGGINPTAPTGAFVAGGEKPQAGGGTGGGGLSTGGTSAAKDDSAKGGGETPGKTAAGTYSGADNTAAGSYSRNGGGAPVGMDNSFADLLKKFLPGGEEEKKTDGNLAFDQDRNPASDAAAVLGRNKNIFDEVHKRYEKKSTEGAIVF